MLRGLAHSCLKAFLGSPYNHAAGTQQFAADSRESRFHFKCIPPLQKKKQKNAYSYCRLVLSPPCFYFSLHSSPQWAARGAEVNTDVSLCLQSKVAAQRNFIFYECGTSPRCSLHQRVWLRLRSAPRALTTRHRASPHRPPELTGLIISAGLLV